MELMPFGIRVVLIEPGAVGHTRFTRHSLAVSEPYWGRPSRYSAAYRGMQGERGASVGGGPVPAETIATLVRKVSEARRPRARYTSHHGQSALIRLTKAFPRRWIDRAVTKYMELETTGGKP